MSFSRALVWAYFVLLLLLFLACDFIKAAEPTPGPGTVPPRKAVDSRLPPTLADIESRMPDSHQYRSEDLVNWAHESTHALRRVNTFEIGRPPFASYNRFYLLEGRSIVLREPRFGIQAVFPYAPAEFRSVLDAIAWNGWRTSPLYLLDEWIAYTHGAMVACELAETGRLGGDRLESHGVGHMLRLGAYATALLIATDKLDPSYPDRQLLIDLVTFNMDRSMEIAARASKLPRVGSSDHARLITAFKSHFLRSEEVIGP